MLNFLKSNKKNIMFVISLLLNLLGGSSIIPPVVGTGGPPVINLSE